MLVLMTLAHLYRDTRYSFLRACLGHQSSWSARIVATVVVEVLLAGRAQ